MHQSVVVDGTPENRGMISKAYYMLKVEEDSFGCEQVKDLCVELAFSPVRLVVDGEARHHDVKGTMWSCDIEPLRRGEIRFWR